MKKIWIMLLVVVALFCGIAFRSHAEGANLRGEYVEARSASVFAGACHYNGELTTAGREALLAWNITSGQWKGVDMSGVKAIAIIAANANLAERNANRHSEIVVDQAASDAQVAAMTDVLKSKFASTLGQFATVTRASVEFNHANGTFIASAGQRASIDVDVLPNDECCRMPNLVWYSPFVPLLDRKVGFTQKVSYAGGDAGEPWERAGENSAFYGNFAF